MIKELAPYPAYKPSRIPWAGKLPAHWEVRRAKWLFREMNRPARDTDEVVTCFRDGTVTLRRNRRVDGFTEALQEIGYQGIRRGDLVIHGMDAFAGAIGVSDSDGKGTPVYSVCLPKSAANAHFYAAALRETARAGWIQALAKGVRERSTDFRFETFAAQPMPVPPPGEQAAIVRFLDYVDRRIHSYLVAKHKLLGILNEQISAVVKRAVSRGLDATVVRRSTGVDWLGDVPNHWDVRLLKTICSMRSGEGITSASIESSGAFPVYGGNGVRGYTSRFTHDGDYALIGRQGALCGNVHLARGRFWASEHAIVATPKAGIDVEWLAALLRAMDLNQYSIAAAQPGLAVERILRLRVPIPPRPEQKNIADHIQRATRRLDGAIDSVRREVALVREYRTRLIADVVTGKRDVREAVSRLPTGDAGGDLEELVDPPFPDGTPEGVEESAEVRA